MQIKHPIVLLLVQAMLVVLTACGRSDRDAHTRGDVLIKMELKRLLVSARLEAVARQDSVTNVQELLNILRAGNHLENLEALGVTNIVLYPKYGIWRNETILVPSVRTQIALIGEASTNKIFAVTFDGGSIDLSSFPFGAHGVRNRHSTRGADFWPTN